MVGIFTKVGNALGFRSSQINSSSMNNTAAIESPFRSSQSYLNTKEKSVRKRKSFEESGGSGKKKSKKQRQSLVDEPEFEGFGSMYDDYAHQNAPSLPVNIRRLNSEEDLQNSNRKFMDAMDAHIGKKQKAPGEDSELGNGTNGEKVDAHPQPMTAIAFQNGESAIEQRMSRSQRKKAKKRLRRSMELARQKNGTELKDSDQPVNEHTASATTPGPLIFNGVTAETPTKSKKKKEKKRRLSAVSTINNADSRVQDSEVEIEKAVSSPNLLASPKKKSKKRKKLSLGTEANVSAKLIVDQLQDVINGQLGTLEPMEDEDAPGDFKTVATPKKKQKRAKAEILEDQEVQTFHDNYVEPFRGNETTAQKSKKSKKDKKVRRSSDAGVSAGLHDLLNNVAQPEASNASGFDPSEGLVSIPEPEKGNGIPSHAHVNGTQHIVQSLEPEQDPNLIALQSKVTKTKKLKKIAASNSIDQAEADTHIKPPTIRPEIQKPSVSKLGNSRSSMEASPTIEETLNIEPVISSKSKKSKIRSREKAATEPLKTAEDDLVEYIHHNPVPEGFIQPGPPPSWKAINSQATKPTPSQTIGIYKPNGSKISNLGRAKTHTVEGRQPAQDGETSRILLSESPANDDLGEQFTVKLATAGSKRKRTVKANGDDVNLEALRLPAKKRRTIKSADQSAEESEVNPEALRLPEKKKPKKSTTAVKKSTASATRASTSNDIVKLRGPFTDEEADTIKSVLDSFGESHNLTEHSVREILQANARTNAKTSSLLKELYEALPNRPPESIVKVARRKFHNFARYGKWTPEEDEDLREAVERHSKSWVKVAADLDRHPEDVRDRWRNYGVCGSKLDKGPWTKNEEDDMMNKIQERLETLRNTWPPGQYEKELKKGRTEYELLDWNYISNDMGRTRSRLQCQQKYKQLIDRKAPGASWTRKEDPETQSWRTTKGKAEVIFMKPGDKLMLLRGIQRAGFGREEKIAFQKIGDEAFRTSFTEKAKKLAVKFMRRDIPGQKQMTLQEVVAQAIENIETKWPNRLEERYDPEVDGETYPTRKRRSAPRSGRMVTESDEESSGGSSSEESEEDQQPAKRRLRDRMKRSNEVDDEDHRIKKSKNRAPEPKVRDDDEMDADRDDDVEMLDGEAGDTQSRLSSDPLSLANMPEIAESDDGDDEFSSHRNTTEQNSDDEDEAEEGEENNAESIDPGTIRNLANTKSEHDESVSNEQDYESSDEADNQIGKDEEEENERDSNERQRRDSSASSRGRDFRLGRKERNLEDVEISSDDSVEDIPAFRPVVSPEKRVSRSMVKRRAT